MQHAAKNTNWWQIIIKKIKIEYALQVHKSEKKAFFSHLINWIFLHKELDYIEWHGSIDLLCTGSWAIMVFWSICGESTSLSGKRPVTQVLKHSTSLLHSFISINNSSIAKCKKTNKTKTLWQCIVLICRWNVDLIKRELTSISCGDPELLLALSGPRADLLRGQPFHNCIYMIQQRLFKNKHGTVINTW